MCSNYESQKNAVLRLKVAGREESQSISNFDQKFKQLEHCPKMSNFEHNQSIGPALFATKLKAIEKKTQKTSVRYLHSALSITNKVNLILFA